MDKKEISKILIEYVKEEGVVDIILNYKEQIEDYEFYNPVFDTFLDYFVYLFDELILFIIAKIFLP